MLINCELIGGPHDGQTFELPDAHLNILGLPETIGVNGHLLSMPACEGESTQIYRKSRKLTRTGRLIYEFIGKDIRAVVSRMWRESNWGHPGQRQEDTIP